jgi:hypothetical protein
MARGTARPSGVAAQLQPAFLGDTEHGNDDRWHHGLAHLATELWVASQRPKGGSAGDRRRQR